MMESIRQRPDLTMQPYEYSISLRVWHPAMAPAEITRTLQFVPRVLWKAGDPRVTPAGTPLSGTRAETYWYVDLCSKTAASTESLESSLGRFLRVLRTHEAFFLRVREEGGRVEFYVGVFGPGSFGFEFDASLMADLASAGFTLSIEVYPVPQNA